jgi:hypothetical protein
MSFTTGQTGRSRKRAAPPPLLDAETIDLQEPGPLAVTIPAPNIRTVVLDVVGTAPLMVHKFSQKAITTMAAKQKEGSTGTKGRKRDPKDFEEVFQAARHLAIEGWDGYPAGGIRQALISACGLVDFAMTTAKKCLFVEADGTDATEGTPLVRILGGEPERNTRYARNTTGVADIRCRPLWRHWHMQLRIRYDADRFTADDVTNLVMRAGEQCGLGEGRPASKKSSGLGLGTFRLKQDYDA